MPLKLHPFSHDKECATTGDRPNFRRGSEMTSKLIGTVPRFLYNYHYLVKNKTYGGSDELVTEHSRRSEPMDSVCRDKMRRDIAMVSVQMATDVFTK